MLEQKPLAQETAGIIRHAPELMLDRLARFLLAQLGFVGGDALLRLVTRTIAIQQILGTGLA
jgi:hypothetical protein